MQKIYKYGHWRSFCEIDTTLYHGFIYVIINTITDQKYIGKKNFHTKYSQNNKWQYYLSSSVYVSKALNEYGYEAFTFTILELCNSNSLLDKREAEIQIQHNVLTSLLPDGTREYYNRSIHKIGFNTTGTTVSANTLEKKRRNLLQKKLKGLPAGRQPSQTLYSFTHLATCTTFNGTLYEFANMSTTSIPCAYAILHGKSASTKGWALSSTIDKLPIFTIVNNNTNSMVTGHRYYIEHIVGFNIYVILNGTSYRGWTLYNKHNLSSKINPIYKFINIDTLLTFHGSRKEFSKKYNLNERQLRDLINGKTKIHKKWQIVDNNIDFSTKIAELLALSATIATDTRTQVQKCKDTLAARSEEERKIHLHNQKTGIKKYFEKVKNDPIIQANKSKNAKAARAKSRGRATACMVNFNFYTSFKFASNISGLSMYFIRSKIKANIPGYSKLI